MEDDDPKPYVDDMEVAFSPERPSTKGVGFRNQGKDESRNRPPQQMYKRVASRGKEKQVIESELDFDEDY
ncbi:hypothetical protein GOBAR_AA09836 [Gossypium barbadense]|uniref:Uncharacterized protein n=1 Tax=Gossypium barbadense TaxID=3634 RepID=A0A2P5Y5D6_GOSBA|nr:hypothetical protein GOBAR_AA09836 [Gossypium barbadense]